MRRLSLAIAFLTAPAAAQILPAGFVVETLAAAQHGPTSLDFLPDGRLLFVEQDTGAVKVLSLAAANAVATLGAVPGLRVSYSRGLLGFAVDPQWPARPYVYCYHTNLAAADLRITRFLVTGDLSTPTSTNLQLGSAYTVLHGLPDASPLHEAGCLRRAKPARWCRGQRPRAVPAWLRAEDMFKTTAARTRVFSACSSSSSPSWRSMARLVLPSRLELKRRAGSSREAPLAKVNFTTFA